MTGNGQKPSDLDDAISRVLEEMKTTDLDSDKYLALLSNLESLVRLKKEQSANRISPDTKALVAANLIGILIIVGYERGHVMVSRGLNFVLRSGNQ
jgi:hypothetical protein